jgi:hypothetical protein
MLVLFDVICASKLWNDTGGTPGSGFDKRGIDELYSADDIMTFGLYTVLKWETSRSCLVCCTWFSYALSRISVYDCEGGGGGINNPRDANCSAGGGKFPKLLNGWPCGPTFSFFLHFALLFWNQTWNQIKIY